VGLPVDTLFHPTFLYEMWWNLLGAMVIMALTKRFTLQWGSAFGLYLIWYGVGRFFLETLRLDVAEVIFGLRSNQWASIAGVVIGLIIFVAQKRRHPGMEPSVYHPGKEWEPPVTIDSEDRYWLDDRESDGGEQKASAATSDRPRSQKASS
jgi:hypothetical protein